MTSKSWFLLLFTTLTTLLFAQTNAYSALLDIKLIREYKDNLKHAKIARGLVHKNNWASVGTISTNNAITGYPMVNVIAIDDSDINGKSTGKIRFMLTDLDFTGPDWKANNKVTITLTDEQILNCRIRGIDPMEPTCARVMLSGQVHELTADNSEYADAIAAFNKRHPASINWMKAHKFYLGELKITNIYMLDAYGGPPEISPELYYAAEPDI